MKLLVIGGTGLISTAITRLLVEQHDVTLYNRGQREASTVGATLLLGDRTDHATFERQMVEAGTFDCVIDMVGYTPEDGESVVRAFQGRVGQFIFCSTVDVYKKPASRYPYTEDEEYGGLNTYSRNKVAIEQRLWQAAEDKAFPLTVIRPAATYGEGRGPLSPLSGPNMYIDRLRKGKPIIVHGDGSSLWVSCYRDDVARAFVAAAGNQRTLGHAYHTTGEEWLTWDIYHQQVAEAIGAPPPTIVHIPTDVLVRAAPKRAAIIGENFQYHNIFNNTAANHDLDFRYTTTWKDGVRRMVTYLDDHGLIKNSDHDALEDRLIDAWRQSERALGDLEV